jgi:hypothetical protein
VIHILGDHAYGSCEESTDSWTLPRLELRDIPGRWPAATMPSPPRIDTLA